MGGRAINYTLCLFYSHTFLLIAALAGRVAESLQTTAEGVLKLEYGLASFFRYYVMTLAILLYSFRDHPLHALVMRAFPVNLKALSALIKIFKSLFRLSL